MITVKKYQNRKLYMPSIKTEEGKVPGKYITYSELLTFVKSGTKLQVIDDKTKMDITQKSIFNAIAERAEKDADLRDAVINNYLNGFLEKEAKKTPFPDVDLDEPVEEHPLVAEIEKDVGEEAIEEADREEEFTGF